MTSLRYQIIILLWRQKIKPLAMSAKCHITIFDDNKINNISNNNLIVKLVKSKTQNLSKF